MRMQLAAAVLSLVGLAGALQAQGTMTGMAPGGDPARTIAEAVAASPMHATLAMAIEAAGLTGTLAGAGPYTLLAPTDDAFAALPEGLVDEMLRPENREALTSALLCHVIDGRLVTGDLAQMEEAGTAGPEGVAVETLGGCTLLIRSTEAGGVTVTDENGTVADVVVPDVPQANGVIQVIDAIASPAGM